MHIVWPFVCVFVGNRWYSTPLVLVVDVKALLLLPFIWIVLKPPVVSLKFQVKQVGGVAFNPFLHGNNRSSETSVYAAFVRCVVFLLSPHRFISFGWW